MSETMLPKYKPRPGHRKEAAVYKKNLTVSLPAGMLESFKQYCLKNNVGPSEVFENHLRQILGIR